MLDEFKNCRLSDFSDDTVQARMIDALGAVKKGSARSYPLLIGGENILSEKTITSYDPSSSREIVGLASKGSREDAARALDSAWEAFASWKDVPVQQRAEVLLRAARIMSERRLLFAAL